jgi:hypothetical protein
MCLDTHPKGCYSILAGLKTPKRLQVAFIPPKASACAKEALQLIYEN